MITTNRLLVILTAVILLAGYFSLPGLLPLREAEAREAGIALEMLFTGNYLQARFQGLPIYQPTVFNWLVAAVFQLAGSFGNWGVRLPGLLALLATAGLHYLFVEQYYSRRMAVVSVLFFLTGWQVLFFASVYSGGPELVGASVIYAQAILFFHYFQRDRYLLLHLLSYLLTALGILTVGLTALWIQWLIMLALSVYYRNYRLIFCWQHLIGLAAGGGMLWLYARALMLNGSLELFAGSIAQSALEGSIFNSNFSAFARHFLLFPLRLLLALLPWSLLLVFLIPAELRGRLQQNELLVYSVLLISASGLLFWLAPGTQIDDLFPLFPFLSLLSAFAYEQRQDLLPLRILLMLPLVFATGRLVFNLVAGSGNSEARQEESKYQEMIIDITARARRDPVKWTGEPLRDTMQLRLAGRTLWDTLLVKPRPLPATFVFQMARAIEHPFHYEADPGAKTLYLSYERFARGREARIIRIYDGWNNRRVVLAGF